MAVEDEGIEFAGEPSQSLEETEEFSESRRSSPTIYKKVVFHTQILFETISKNSHLF